MEPNYSEYSILELEDALNTIDSETYPDRTRKIYNELSSRQMAIVIDSEIVEDGFEPNEQFFRCPTCENKISFFSKAANKWGKIMVCPHCSSPFESSIKLKVVAIAFIPIFIIHLLFLRPLVESFGLNGAISTGILCVISIIFSTRYRKVKGNNKST
jgi:predicted RNA-binding Zn-ribbon protein involved in translation (DUF1610 family)